jgi:pre-mRNA-splicing factor CWC22
VDKEEMLDVFRFDPNFEENELLWDQIKKEILGDDDDEDEDGEEEGGDGEEEGEHVLIHFLSNRF